MVIFLVMRIVAYVSIMLVLVGINAPFLAGCLVLLGVFVVDLLSHIEAKL